MIDIHFEIGGRKISPDRIGDALERAIFEEVTAGVKNTLASVRCAEHGQMPRVKIKGRNINNLSWEVKGCCQPLIDNALKKLK